MRSYRLRRVARRRIRRRIARSHGSCRKLADETVSTVLKLTVHEVDASRWPDFERLFMSRGAPKAARMSRVEKWVRYGRWSVSPFVESFAAKA
jgi:hypothetical protein